MTSRDDEAAITRLLLGHMRVGGVRDIRAHCGCGWNGEPTPNRMAAHVAHVAAVLAAHMADREADAWRMGVQWADGPITAAGWEQVEPHNPFRLTPDTEGETDE